jgi:hypothetical protein
MKTAAEMDSRNYDLACRALDDVLQGMDERTLLRRMNVGSIESINSELRPRLILDEDAARVERDGTKYRLGYYDLPENAPVTSKPVLTTRPLDAATVELLTDPAKHPEYLIHQKRAADRERREAEVQRKALAAETWTALPPVSRAAYLVANYYGNAPELRMLLQALAAAVRAETARPSDAPSNWEG